MPIMDKKVSSAYKRGGLFSSYSTHHRPIFASCNMVCTSPILLKCRSTILTQFLCNSCHVRRHATLLLNIILTKKCTKCKKNALFKGIFLPCIQTYFVFPILVNKKCKPRL